MIAIAITKYVIFVGTMEGLANLLAKRMRKLRGEQTQRAFARKLGISQTALNHIEQGRENVTLKTLQTICVRLNCTIGSLFEK